MVACEQRIGEKEKKKVVRMAAENLSLGLSSCLKKISESRRSE
jgi:hypothetical protein